MRDILPDLIAWQADGRSIALATVVQTWGSAPRRAGSMMAISADGQMSGSVSGGCVENAVVDAAVESLRANRPELLHFGVSDEAAWDVGLACGGSIDVFVQALNEEIFTQLKAALLEERVFALATVIRGPSDLIGHEIIMTPDANTGFVLGGELDDRLSKAAREAVAAGESSRLKLNADLEIFLQIILPSLALVIVGGVHIAIALASMARTLGFRTVVIDPRRAWGNDERFPNVDQLVQEWPPQAFDTVQLTGNTAVTMLTHDPKIDDPSTRIALLSPAFYVGALGSKTTNLNRRARLLESGLSEEQISRLHAPIGLDIGARTPEEIALAIMAQIVEAQRTRVHPALATS